MNNSIKLPPGHLVRVYRTYKPVQSFEILSHVEFKAEDGTVYGQQEVFGPSYDRVEVVDPSTGHTTKY